MNKNRKNESRQGAFEVWITQQDAVTAWDVLTPTQQMQMAWNAAIEAALLKTPGGNHCDPQAVADDIRTLMS